VLGPLGLLLLCWHVLQVLLWVLQQQEVHCRSALLLLLVLSHVAAGLAAGCCGCLCGAYDAGHLLVPRTREGNC
jgi:hypothetical protein